MLLPVTAWRAFQGRYRTRSWQPVLCQVPSLISGQTRRNHTTSEYSNDTYCERVSDLSSIRALFQRSPSSLVLVRIERNSLSTVVVGDGVCGGSTGFTRRGTVNSSAGR
jgi:hypothetical protein